MRLTLHATLAVVAFSLLPWADPAIAKSPRALFGSDDIINLTIKGPINDMSRNTDAKPVAGVLTVKDGTPETLPIMLSARGITRRRKDICSFPPLRVDFTDKVKGDSIFKGQKKLKLVTHCQSTDSFQQYVLLEYAAYKLYQALTPDSFRVRLANIDYVNDDGRPIATRLGFFVEDIDDVAKRNGLKRLRGVNHIAVGQLDADGAARFALYQYMISNLDWAMTASVPGDDCCHNSRLLGVKDATTALTPVPYDFDESGLVNTPYAAPPAIIRVPDVVTRRYRGFCQHNTQVQALAADLSTHRAAMLAILDGTPQLSERTRSHADAYLGEFFDQISAPEKIATMMKTCL